MNYVIKLPLIDLSQILTSLNKKTIQIHKQWTKLKIIANILKEAVLCTPLK